MKSKMKNNCMFMKIKCLYQKNNEIVSYVFWGACTTLVSIFSFIVSNKWLGMHELVANVTSWLLAVLFAYVTNRIYVFKSSVKGWKKINEILLFFFLG